MQTLSPLDRPLFGTTVYDSRMELRTALPCLVLAVAASLAAAADAPLFPDVSLAPLDSGKEPTPLSSFRGRPVLLTFWASWCAPCRFELPEFSRLHAELADRGFVFVTVTMDSSNAAALRFLDATRLEIPVYRMRDRDLAKLRVRAIPTSFLIRPDGRAEQIYQGYAPDVAADIRARVLAMLEETEARPS